jgi:hypothetical protein
MFVLDVDGQQGWLPFEQSPRPIGTKAMMCAVKYGSEPLAAALKASGSFPEFGTLTSERYRVD